MRVHHLNCISTCPVGGALMDGRTKGIRGRLACHCLLVELPRELVLVDTGLGLGDVADPNGRLSRLFLTLLAPDFREDMTAARQIQRLGFDIDDVRHIVLTHLDFDHAGGIGDFPQATVHLLAHESESARARRTMLDRMRYRPQQWETTIPRWMSYEPGEGEPWRGFACVRDLFGLPPEILLVPLIGHTLGHAGVAIELDDRALLNAGDAYFFHDEMNTERPRCTPGLRAYQWLMEKRRGARLWNQERLRDLKKRDARVQIFCGHDPVEFERLAGRGMDTLPPVHASNPPGGGLLADLPA